MRVCLLALLLVGCGSGLSRLTEQKADSGEDTGPLDVNDTDDTDGIGDPIGDDDDDDDTDPANQPPTADAGPDQTVLNGQVVALDGSASDDADGDSLDYSWVFTATPSASTAILLNDDKVDPEFWADVDGTYVVELTVDDGDLTDVDEVEILVETPNEVPVAVAGQDQTVTVGDSVVLDGSASYDPDNDPLSFQWTMTGSPSGSAAVLFNATSSVAGFTADAPGTFVVELVVKDGTNASQPDSITITASEDSDSGGDCSSCVAMNHRLSLGDVASGPGLVLLPVLLVVARRRKQRVEAG